MPTHCLGPQALCCFCPEALGPWEVPAVPSGKSHPHLGGIFFTSQNFSKHFWSRCALTLWWLWVSHMETFFLVAVYYHQQQLHTLLQGKCEYFDKPLGWEDTLRTCENHRECSLSKWVSFLLVEFVGKVQSSWDHIIKEVLEVTIKGRRHETIVSRKGILGDSLPQEAKLGGHALHISTVCHSHRLCYEAFPEMSDGKFRYSSAIFCAM